MFHSAIIIEGSGQQKHSANIVYTYDSRWIRYCFESNHELSLEFLEVEGLKIVDNLVQVIKNLILT